MANNSLVLTIESELTQSELQNRLRIDTVKTKEAQRNVVNFLKAIPNNGKAKLTIQTGASAPVAATGTVTFASFVENDTVTVAGITFTGKDAPSGEVQFLASGSNSADATAFAAAINAHSTISKILSASAASAVVTLTCLVPGVVGNFLDLAISAHGSVSAAALAGGTGGAQETVKTYALGL